VTTLNEPIAKRIGRLVRMFGSDNENERRNALERLVIVCHNEGLSFNDLATVIENSNGEIEELKYSDADAAAIYSRGVEKGRAERPTQEATEFFDSDGAPLWYEIAVFCRDNQGHSLSTWEKGFVEDMPSKIAGYGRPTSAQAKHLLRIFIKLGGIVDAKVVKAFM
jgi:hypothetical protein